MPMKPLVMLAWMSAAALAVDEPPSRAEPVVEPAAEDEGAAGKVVAPPPGAAVRDMAISRTEQFRVSGADGLVRGTVAVMAEEAKAELLALTGDADAWKVPVTIVLHGKAGDPMPPRSVAMRLWISEAGYDLRVDVHLSHGIEMESFKHAITSALLYERTLRARPKAEGADEPLRLAVPPWLVEGIREANAWRLKRGDRRLYETLFKHGGLFKLDELFAVDEAGFELLDGAMRAAYRGSSGAVVMALLAQPEGRQGFTAMLAEVAAFQGEMPLLLRRHFPDLNLSETSLAKWWMLQLAQLTTPTLTDVMPVVETEEALGEALQLHFRAEDGAVQRKGLEAWQEVAALKESERTEAVRPAQDALVRLSYRCFPSFRPVIAEYQLVLNAIARGNSRKLNEQLAALRVKRDEMVSLSVRGRDYLDWFEITRARETSGAFEDYRRLKERLQENPITRTDPLSSYLDRMEKIFKRKDVPAAPAMPGGLAAPADSRLWVAPGDLPPPDALPLPPDIPPPPPVPPASADSPIDLPPP